MPPLDPSHLPGTHRTRVFVGGSYRPTNRLVLAVITDSVRNAGFDPIVADEFALPLPELDIHDVTLNLLHSCRIAVFDLSTLSGAMMELERCADYGIWRALVLYQDPFNRQWPAEPRAWDTTAMIKALVRENPDRFKIRPYVRPRDAASRTQSFLTAIRRSDYGKLHNL
jgi:hypothetical protein